MPKRSNEFQRLIFMLKTLKAAESTVTESAMVPDSLTGALVEVDVWIEKQVAGHAVYVALECRDQARAQGVAWVNEMKTKHERLPTSLLVLVSSSGFVKDARKLARKYHIDLLELEKINVSKAKSLVAGLSSMEMHNFNIVPVRAWLDIVGEDGVSTKRIEGEPEFQVVRNDASESSLKEYVRRLVSEPYVGAEVGKERRERMVRVRYAPDASAHPGLSVRTSEGATLLKISLIEIHAAVKVKSSRVDAKHGAIGGHNVAWATVKTDEEEVLMMAAETITVERVTSEDICRP